MTQNERPAQAAVGLPELWQDVRQRWRLVTGWALAGLAAGGLAIWLITPKSLLQNSQREANFPRLEARAGDAGCHFWHDVVIETKIIRPARWILPNPN